MDEHNDPAERALDLAKELGELIRATAPDPADRREAVDALLQVIEKAAGLRL